MDFKQNMRRETAGRERKRDMKDRLKEKVDHAIGTMRTDIPKYTEPIHQNFVTFHSTDKKWRGKGMRKKRTRNEEKEPHFGKDRRFPRDPDTIWKERLKVYNSGTNGKFRHP